MLLVGCTSWTSLWSCLPRFLLADQVSPAAQLAYCGMLYSSHMIFWYEKSSFLEAKEERASVNAFHSCAAEPQLFRSFGTGTIDADGQEIKAEEARAPSPGKDMLAVFTCTKCGAQCWSKCFPLL
jgi:hypothetical protein